MFKTGKEWDETIESPDGWDLGSYDTEEISRSEFHKRNIRSSVVSYEVEDA